jgi:hypothetical protein
MCFINEVSLRPADYCPCKHLPEWRGAECGSALNAVVSDTAHRAGCPLTLLFSRSYKLLILRGGTRHTGM